MFKFLSKAQIHISNSSVINSIHISKLFSPKLKFTICGKLNFTFQNYCPKLKILLSKTQIYNFKISVLTASVNSCLKTSVLNTNSCPKLKFTFQNSSKLKLTFQYFYSKLKFTFQNSSVLSSNSHFKNL